MNIKNLSYDVVVVGGGHAGIEAAFASANMGANTVLITLTKNRIGYMPCNPAIGGIGKGHIVFEISALGGLMPQLCTTTYLQAKMLNTKKGPAVHGLRLQIDKVEYNKQSIERLENTENLTILEGMVDELLVNDKKEIIGVKLADKTEISSSCVILTTGTFLNGLVHMGLENYSSGRETEEAVKNLSSSLSKLNIELGRLKTGTPPRLLRSSIDFSQLEKQSTENVDFLFEFNPHKANTKLDCFITHTNEKTHAIIKEHAHLSPIYRKDIVGKGPRYCPSIEDKIMRFSEKNSHQIFVEPESESTDWIYPNGISTSLPLEVQQKFINSIKGFENAIIARAGYAIEYDFVLPNQLSKSLEIKTVPGLFLAGQINGTTGYEEAAGQGIVAGINACLKSKKMEPFILNRYESYIGVMIDDLTTLGIDEPYRMFTSRAENRLSLRQDNAFERLSKYANDFRLISKDRFSRIEEEFLEIKNTMIKLKENFKPTDLLNLFSDNEFPDRTIKNSINIDLSARASQTVQASIKYGPYIERESKEIDKLKKYQLMKLSSISNYKDMQGISIELREKLNRIRPETIAQANLIPGMTPAALSFLIFHVNLKIIQ